MSDHQVCPTRITVQHQVHPFTGYSLHGYGIEVVGYKIININGVSYHFTQEWEFGEDTCVIIVGEKV